MTPNGLNPNGLPPLHQAEGVLPPAALSQELAAAVEAERLRRVAAAVVDAEQAALLSAMEGR